MNPPRALGPMLLGVALATGGCQLGALIGGMAQNAEYQKQLRVPPIYDGLENQSVAVIVDADLSIRARFPMLVQNITHGVSGRLARDVPGATVMSPDYVLRWQYQTPQWNALGFEEMAATLGVSRIVHIEVYEYRLHPEGNQWLWEGVCAASVGVIEADGIAPESYVDSFDIVGAFPTIKGVTRNGATAEQVDYGVTAEFIKRTAWLFHTHLEPKYPDKYRPELDRSS